MESACQWDKRMKEADRWGPNVSGPKRETKVEEQRKGATAPAHDGGDRRRLMTAKMEHQRGEDPSGGGGGSGVRGGGAGDGSVALHRNRREHELDTDEEFVPGHLGRPKSDRGDGRRRRR